MTIDTVFLNGEYMPLQQAKISPLDRGFLFGDGVYEVIPVYAGKPFRLLEHLRRLQNSCDGIRLDNPYTDVQWSEYIQQLIDTSIPAGDHTIYIQITRGAPSARDHLFPQVVEQTVFMCGKALPVTDAHVLEQGLKLISKNDIRWQFCHLKTVSLVANVLLKQMAHDANADEVILLRDSYATEGSSSNFFVVQEGIVKTPPKDNRILPGVTRDLIVELLANNAIPCEETPVPAESLQDSDEIWLCSSTKELMPACMLDNKAIGNGKPGPLWQRTYALFQQYKQSLTGV